MAANYNMEGSNRSVQPTAPPMQWVGPAGEQREDLRYQSMGIDDSPLPGATTSPYSNRPRVRNSINRSLNFAGATVGHFFGVHDDPGNQGWRRTGTYRQSNRIYSPMPYTAGQQQEPAAAAGPPAPPTQESRLTQSLNRARRRVGLKPKEPSKEQVMESLPKFWPVVTVLIALLEIGLLIAVTVSFGLAPIALFPETRQATILGFDNQSVPLSREVVPNFFIGPSSSSLIHSGAMYTPCIRDNTEFQLQTVQTSFQESQFRCCLAGGTRQCGMLPQELCLSNQYRGSILGGASICRREANNTAQCEGGVTLHPCCVGLLGQCVITTKENCSFQDGYWHEDKIICSEINCFDDVCRFSWINRTIGEIPDQGIRFVAAIFLNNGVVTLVILGLIKFYNSWVIERRIGFLRFACIYIISGVGGYLVTGIFDPTSVAVGGSGPLFGLIGVFVVELLQGWKWVKRPCLELFKLVILIGILLAVGTLPYVDNFAQIGGFIFGIIASFIFVPYITLGKWDRAIKLCLIFITTPILLVLFLFGFVAFYFSSDPNFCPQCSYVNCIPYTPTFCKDFISTILSIGG